MLTEYQKRVWHLRYVENLGVAVIAERLGRSVPAIKTAIKSARKRMEVDEKYKHIKGIG